jgi:hypothetical protein
MAQRFNPSHELGRRVSIGARKTGAESHSAMKTRAMISFMKPKTKFIPRHE